MSSLATFLSFSLLFHLLYTFSIFDIYFTSPVVHPARRFSPSSTLPLSSQEQNKEKSNLQPPADRLVLIVGDGLRADTLFKWHPTSLLPPWGPQADLDIPGRRASLALNPDKNWTRDTMANHGDGLFDAAPYLRHAALNRGSWGISHTRVPTESRPGHVALIAGMYEDVSAVTKGWKLNPIAFDSLFNQSDHTFSFGSPDILPMFAMGALPGKVDMEMYGEEEEDFTLDASNLDLWVLDRFKNLLERAKYDANLNNQLRSRKVVFFLHLLGLDTTGHTYRPKSPEYTGNLMVVDAIVSEVERLMDEFYGSANKRTAFIFSADHGMSNKGNHGDGEPDNTRTPLVAWGSGIRTPRSEEATQLWRQDERETDPYYRDWGSLNDFWRQDVKQADITPLMASLLDTNMPANSEGKLPLDYLDVSDEYAAHAALANALEVLEMFRVKHEERSARMIHYVPFPKLSSDDNNLPGSKQVSLIQELLSSKRYTEATELCETLIQTSLEGSQYLQTYDWLILISIVFVGYLGSMIHGLAFLIKTYILVCPQKQQSQLNSRIPLGRVLIISTLLVVLAKFAVEKSPITYHLYASFASYYWLRIVDDLNVFQSCWLSAKKHIVHFAPHSTHPNRRLILSLGFRLVLSIAALELMVTGYLHRIAWSAGFLIIGFVWPAIGISNDIKNRHELLFILWTVCCGVSATFTMSDVDKEESIPLLITSGVMFLAGGVILLQYPQYFLSGSNSEGDGKSTYTSRTLKVISGQMIVLVISTCVTASSSWNLQQKNGLPRLNQALAWVVLGTCLSLPFFYGFKRILHQSKQPPSQRLAIIIFAFAPLYVLLSIRDETLFFACYAVTLLVWARLEASLFEERRYIASFQQDLQLSKSRREGEQFEEKKSSTGRPLEKEDLRTAVFFLFFLHVGFFGTGNVASISSFYLSPVYRLVPIFSPFLMASLLIMKILVPFVILSSVLQQLCILPPNQARIDGSKPRKSGEDLAGPPLLGSDSVGGLGMQDSYPIMLLACLLTDVLALNFLVTVRTEGSWLEIGRSITHFAMSNLLQVFMLILSAISTFILGKPEHISRAIARSARSSQYYSAS